MPSKVNLNNTIMLMLFKVLDVLSNLFAQVVVQPTQIKAIRSVKRYACYAKTAEFRVISLTEKSAINVAILLR